MSEIADQSTKFLGAFGTAVRMSRDAARMSRNQLAERSGLSGPYLSEIESGVKVPSMQAADKLARAMGSTFAQLAELAERIAANPDDPGQIMGLRSALLPVATGVAELEQKLEENMPAIARRLAPTLEAVEAWRADRIQDMERLRPALAAIAAAVQTAAVEADSASPAETDQGEPVDALASAVMDVTRGYLDLWTQEMLPGLVRTEVARAMQGAFASLADEEPP